LKRLSVFDGNKRAREELKRNVG